MLTFLVGLLQENHEWAVAFSLAASILVAVAGVLPSYFITGANLLVFGFWPGLALSFAGEALGAVMAFWLYRKGFRNYIRKQLNNYPRASRLVEAEGRDAFFLIFYLRLLPFVPSGIVTFAGAVGKVRLGIFAVASSLGKVPALFLEAFAVYQVLTLSLFGKILLTLVILYLMWQLGKKILEKDS